MRENKASNDDRLIVARAFDTVRSAQKENCPHFYGFLNEHEAQIVKNCVADDTCVFYGGYDGAQRVIFGAGTDDNDSFPITAVQFLYRKQDDLSHRDFLGALMALDVERSVIGDILVDEGRAVVFIKSEMYPYVSSQITKIGNTGVKISLADKNNLPNHDAFDIINFTVASLRLDVFVSALTKLSREKASKLINSELVCINHCVETKSSVLLCRGDTITIRKYGKFVFSEDNGLSKKGRLRISVKHLR